MSLLRTAENRVARVKPPNRAEAFAERRSSDALVLLSVAMKKYPLVGDYYPASACHAFSASIARSRLVS